MLTESTVAIVKATAPAVKQHGEPIAARMYELLFSKYPQVKSLFAQAPQNQPQVLARAIIAYCENVDTLDTLTGPLDRISRKHVARGVTADHYPLVGECLLQAIQDVLGATATPEIMTSWKEAFFFLAEVMIQREKVLATQNV
jgi:nitric oxide dioxygenase